ncbi:MAG: hypothetical protein Q7R70_04635 [Candidatus Diapherotrites archaeon]|nr:hypothetical protein [Candidatus Diapherotrites archaeon]
MNFKPSKLKVLFSIIAFALVFVALRWIAKPVCSGDICIVPNLFSFLEYELIAAIVVYLAWSLVEKTKGKK